MNAKIANNLKQKARKSEIKPAKKAKTLTKKMLPALNKKFCTVLALFSFRLGHVLAMTCAGCVDLDELNFDRTIARFPYSVVKFDIAFPYGEKHEAYAEFSKAAHLVTDKLLVATVGIKDYGENENKKLGERFKLDDKSFPAIFVFKGNTADYVRFPSYLDVTLDNLKSYVSEHTDLYIGREGCLKEFNALVLNYANLADDLQAQLLTKAEELAKEMVVPSHQGSAQTYLVFMRKINKEGYQFVELETKRLQRLRAGKVSQVNKKELTHKLNILEAFRVKKYTKKPKQDEF